MFNKTLEVVIAASSLVVTFIVLGNPPALHAQAVSIATVNGLVRDEQGALMVGAQIKMTGVDTGVVYNAVTNSDGIYAFPSLPIGAYRLEATVAGFQTYVQTGIVLRVSDHVQIDVAMKVGAVAERVEVTANANLVQTQENAISQVVDQQQIVDLPLNGRDPTQLITISGASINHSDGTNTGSKSFVSSQSIAIAGGAGNETNYLLDGGDNNDSNTNVNLPLPFPDALAEFRVETSTLPARYGLHPGGVVDVVTKSGTNGWHGDLFEFIRNGDVNAFNYFATKQDGLKRNQFGGTFGGRIIRDKLFFFGGFQRSDIRQAPSATTAYVPTPAALAGNFSALDGAGCQANHQPRVIYDPTTGIPLPNDQISVSRFDPAAVALAKYLPTPAGPCGNVSFGIPVQSNEFQYVGRVDWIINAKNTLYGRYFLDSYTLAAFFDPHDILVTGTSGQSERAQTFVLGDTYTLSPSTVNSLHLTFERRRVDREPASNGINAATLGVNMDQYTKDALIVSVNNGGFSVGCGTCALAVFDLTGYQVADDVDIVRGKHQIAFGVDILHFIDYQDNNAQDNGEFTFSGQYTKDPLLDFLTGQLSGFLQNIPQISDFRQNVFGLYVQDTFHVTPKLVINAGLRWEPFLPQHDSQNRGSTFSLAAFNADQTSRVFVNAPAGSLFYGDPGVSNAFTDRRLADLSPRLGLVFNPDGKGKTSIRAGAGLLYDSPGTFLENRVVAQNAPYGPQVTPTNAPFQFSNPWANVPGGDPFPLPPPTKNVAFPLASVMDFLPPHIHAPSVVQRNVSVQHRFSENWVFSISYMGNNTSHLWIGNEINSGVYIPGTCGNAPCSSTANTQARRVLSLANPSIGQNYGPVVAIDDGTSANYNALLTSIEHRFASHFTFLANYTWSKCLGIAAVQSIASEGVIQNPNNVLGDYGPCTFDVPNLFNASVVYKSHFGDGDLMSHLLSNWNIAPLVRYQSGLPVNPVTGTDRSLTGIGVDRPNVVPGQPMYTGAPHGLHYQYLNPNLYTPNALGTFGDAGKDSLRGPGYFDVDVALSRDFQLRERLTLNVRGEAFNLLNHSNFGLPNGSVASSSFGQITTADDPRILQGSMKLIF